MSTEDISRFSIAPPDSRIFLGSETASRTPASAATAEREASALCVPDLVRHSAALAPGALALQDASVRLTYQELESRSNQLAYYLSSLGVLPGSVVGVCLERSVEFPVAALAVLKAGAAYLPLDTKTPADRLKMMLRDAQASVVVTQSALLASFAGSARDLFVRHLVVLDRCTDEIGRCCSDPLPVHVTPECLAYVIYTSGSTGTPKAVAVGHDGLLNLVAWHNRSFAVTRADVATQLASIGFDAAVWELWPHLVAGAAVHVVDDAVRMEPERLRDWLVREKVTITFVPTPLAEPMLNLAWPEETRLRFLLTGADTLHYYPPAGLPFRLVNNYGPTECTVVATSATIPPQQSAASLPPIGRPVDAAEIYILDYNMRQVPDGQLGEICVGGAGLAKGYLNDVKLTAERFVPHPFGKVAHARLYRTGDLGCYLPDGQIAFHGRVDDQVKIRGHRLEINEIIGALSRHPAVRQCVVTASEDGQGEKHLVAYVVAQTPSLTVSELRDFLARELPNYMIPGTFVSLESLPIGATGKVDRSALPAPNEENLLRDDAFVGARTPLEERVAAIVASLLGLDRNSLGVNDNFFYFGGNSLFGTQVIARLRETFDVELPLLRIFDYPTITGLAAEVERLMVAQLEAMSEEEAQRLLDRKSA